MLPEQQRLNRVKQRSATAIVEREKKTRAKPKENKPRATASLIFLSLSRSLSLSLSLPPRKKRQKSKPGDELDHLRLLRVELSSLRFCCSKARKKERRKKERKRQLKRVKTVEETNTTRKLVFFLFLSFEIRRQVPQRSVLTTYTTAALSFFLSFQNQGF